MPQLDVIPPQQGQPADALAQAGQYPVAGYYPLADWTPALGWGIVLIGLAVIAGMARWLVKAAIGNPIPYEQRMELEKRYGRWAVQTAIRVCPLDDIECIKREAARLYQSRILRR